jgi:hypothetical protein
MAIEFEYLNNFGLKRTANVQTEPLEIKPPKEGEELYHWEHHTKSNIERQLHHIMWAFNMDMRPMFIVDVLFYEIKFLGVKPEDWSMEGTAKKMDYWFLTPRTTEPLEPRIKYKFKLSEQGIKLFNLIDSLYVLTDYNKAIVQAVLKKSYEHIIKENRLK